MGLLWKIKGSYTDRFRFVKGIDMTWISAHPNEEEFALFDQYIPIDSTVNFGSMDEKIDILMQQIISFKERIISPLQFYKRIGFKYQAKYFENISSHRHLYERTANGQNVSYRLFRELNIRVAEIRLFATEAKDIVKPDNIKLNISTSL